MDTLFYAVADYQAVTSLARFWHIIRKTKNAIDMRYFRQALALMREEKLYSAMYIAGTALAVAFVMLIAKVYYVKVADIAPEVHRSTTYKLPHFAYQKQTGYTVGIDYQMFRINQGTVL